MESSKQAHFKLHIEAFKRVRSSTGDFFQALIINFAVFKTVLWPAIAWCEFTCEGSCLVVKFKCAPNKEIALVFDAIRQFLCLEVI